MAVYRSRGNGPILLWCRARLEGGRGSDMNSSQHTIQLPLSLSDLMTLSIECGDSWLVGDGACGLADIGEQDRLTGGATSRPTLARRNSKLSLLGGSLSHHDGRRGCGMSAEQRGRSGIGPSFRSPASTHESPDTQVMSI